MIREIIEGLKYKRRNCGWRDRKKKLIDRFAVDQDAIVIDDNNRLDSEIRTEFLLNRICETRFCQLDFASFIFSHFDPGAYFINERFYFIRFRLFINELVNTGRSRFTPTMADRRTVSINKFLNCRLQILFKRSVTQFRDTIPIDLYPSLTINRSYRNSSYKKNLLI